MPGSRAAGFASSFLAANGAEPAYTWPSGIQAEGMDTDGDPGCLDYIWVRGEVRVVGLPARLGSPGRGRPDAVSRDHLGLAAHLEIGR